MKNFILINKLNTDISRPVADMAAFFDYYVVAESGVQLMVCAEGEHVIACLYSGEHSFTAREFCSGTAASGEVTRCVKLVVLGVFVQLTGMQPKLPWGILTGVRPGKLAHKLLDSGVSAKNLPQYLSQHYLLPASQGKLLTNIALRQKKLLPDASRFKDAGIYIGVPYCLSRCSYCSFPAGIVPQDEESQQNFVNLIEQDLQNVVQLLSMHSLQIKSLYIGGGTPTSLSDKVFANLLKVVENKLLKATVPALQYLQEFTVEAGRPDCFSIDKLAAMESVGVNRISVNPQTFHDKTLQLIGRRHSVADFYVAYELVRKSRIPVINMDLIIGLPQETAADICYSFEQAVKLAPENLTVHTLTLKRSAPLFGELLHKTLSVDEAAQLVMRGFAAAKSLGMEPYYLYRQHYMLGHLANIGYAKPGAESIYNIQMMEERHPVIGVGPSSASKVPLVDGHHLHKLNMPKNVAVYAANLVALADKRANLFN